MEHLTKGKSEVKNVKCTLVQALWGSRGIAVLYRDYEGVEV
jgi:hypothetical protein